MKAQLHSKAAQEKNATRPGSGKKRRAGNKEGSSTTRSKAAIAVVAA
jgi:hypothetical protein